MGTPDDAALGLPPVMTGPDSTRTLDNLTKWGVTLFGPCSANCYEYRSASGLYRWSSMIHKWFKQCDISCGYGTWEETKSNPPTIPPPDWQPHDGTKPGPTTPCRTDAASLSAKPDKYGEVLAREFDAFVKLRSSLTTDAQRTYLAAYDAAITDSREAFRAGLTKGGAQ